LIENKNEFEENIFYKNQKKARKVLTQRRITMKTPDKLV
jgi:hypothetical protein